MNQDPLLNTPPSKRNFIKWICNCFSFPSKSENSKETQINSDENYKHNPLLNFDQNLSQKTNKSIKINEKGKIEKKYSINNICNCQSKNINNKNSFYVEDAHYEKIINNKKLNPEKKARLSENFRVLNSLNKYKKNELFFLKYNSNILLCKITYKNFKLQTSKLTRPKTTKSLINKNPPKSILSCENKTEIKEFDERLNIFSLYHEGIKIDSDSYEKTLPEKICMYFAKKVQKNSTILDAFCGIGSASIQVNK